MGYMNSFQTIDRKVIDKCRIQNGNICIIIEDENKKKGSNLNPSFGKNYNAYLGNLRY